MSFGQAVQSYFQNYVNFSGRAPRSAYWWVFLFNILAAVVAVVLDNVLGLSFKMHIPGSEAASMGYGPIYATVALGLILPSLSLTFRRLHDRNKSGVWLLLVFIPIVGAIVLFIWFLMRGTVGDNRFGPDPLAAK